MSTEARTYDELPYDDAAYFHTHPSNLAVVATFCGMEPAPVETCRVLELGCAGGFNLLAMSHSLPAARFVGVDYSPRQIERGREMIAALGCTNVELHTGDVAALDPALGEFDYIIAHGVYSWMPPTASDALLAACRRHLVPNGIAYISYNTFPGWHSRLPLRDLLRFHADPALPPLERTRQARAALERIIACMPDAESPAARSLRAEAEAIRNDPHAYVFHEYLEADNRPLLFEEFARRAASHGLQFLAEARFSTNSFVQREPIRSALAAAGEDLLRREQQHDFLRNRQFRQSLLCRAEVRPTWLPTVAGVGRLFVRAKVSVLSEGEFHIEEAGTLTTSDPVLRAILAALGAAWPRMTRVRDLAAKVELPEVVIVDGYIEGLWHLFAFDPPFAVDVEDRPQACPLARFEAERGGSVTNRLHRPVTLTPRERDVLLRLDGRTAAVAYASGSDELDHILARFAEQALLAPRSHYPPPV